MNDRLNIEELRHELGASMEVFLELRPPLSSLTAEKFQETESFASAKLTLMNAGNGVEVKGAITIPYESSCARCLAPFCSQAHIKIREIVPYKNPAGELNLLEGNEFLLGRLLEDILPVELAPYPLCGHECQGICPQCGRDLNLGDCGCRKDRSDPRWEVLKQLKL